MISPEQLRRYNFFSSLDESELVALAMIAEEVTFERDEKIFGRSDTAEALYFLIEGSVGLYDPVEEGEQTIQTRGIPVGEINPGEPFSISALIDPYILTSSAFSSTCCRALRFEAADLRLLLDGNRHLANTLTQKTATAALDRLQSICIQLAAALA